MTDALLHLQQVTIATGRQVLLQIDDLAVNSGELLVILGPNGAGKSTLLRACLGLQRIWRGRIHLLAKPVHCLSAWSMARLRRQVGYVPQSLESHGQMPLTARQVVAIGRTGLVATGRRLRRSDWDVVDHWMDQLGTAHLADRLYWQLSGGEQRRLLIARAMVQEPRLLLLDEPAAHLDIGAREQIIQTLVRLRGQTGITTVLVCHELESIPPGCQRVVLLESGRAVADGRPVDVLTSDRVEALYGIRAEVLQHHDRLALVPTGAGT